MTASLTNLAGLTGSPRVSSPIPGPGMPLPPGAAPPDPAEGLADFLITKSEVPAEYRDKLRPYVVDQINIAKKLPDAHSDDKLMMIAKHTCTKDWIKRAFDEHSKKDAEYQQAVEAGFLAGVGALLGAGFDKIEVRKFVLDKDNKIIGINDPRQSACNAALAIGEALYAGRRRKTIKKKLQKKRKTLRRRKVGRNVH